MVPACPVGVALCVLQGAHRLLLKTTNIKMGVRLGLLKQDHSRALVFEVDSGKMKGEGSSSSRGLQRTSVSPRALTLAWQRVSKHLVDMRSA